MQVVLDLDTVPGVLVGCREQVLGLSNDRWRWTQFEQLGRERSCSRVIFGFDEGRHGESKCELKVSRLETAVSEIGGELKLPLERRWTLLLETSSFDLQRQTDQVLAAHDNQLLQLRTGEIKPETLMLAFEDIRDTFARES